MATQTQQAPGQHPWFPRPRFHASGGWNIHRPCSTPPSQRKDWRPPLGGPCAMIACAENCGPPPRPRRRKLRFNTVADRDAGRPLRRGLRVAAEQPVQRDL
jgi:hypothetical protein